MLRASSLLYLKLWRRTRVPRFVELVVSLRSYIYRIVREKQINCQRYSFLLSAEAGHERGNGRIIIHGFGILLCRGFTDIHVPEFSIGSTTIISSGVL